MLDGLHMRYSRRIVEQAAIVGALDPKIFESEADAATAADTAVVRLNAMAEETERTWQATARDDSGLQFKREVRGVSEAHIIDRALLQSADARKMNQFQADLAELFPLGSIFERKNTQTPIYGPKSLLDAIFAAGRAGLTMQRYKGLGEMNPKQLHETTLDPTVRTLMQVKIGELNEADEIFSKLMGDVVEPRREFIQANALSVANLDI